MTRGIRKTGAFGVTLAALIAVAAISVPASPARPHPGPMPDLVIRDVQFMSTPSQSNSASVPVAVIDHDGIAHFGLSLKVRNVGHARSLLSAVKVVIGGHQIGVILAGPLTPGQSRTVHQNFTRHLGGMGFYRLSACADAHHQVHESKESNNCSRAIRFAAVPQRWNVNQFTAGQHGGSTGDITVRATGMTFDYFGVVDESGTKVFFWLATGGVTDDLSGRDASNCTHSGHGAVSHSPWGDQIDPNHGYLEIEAPLNGYFAKVEDPGHGFTGNTVCDGPPPFSFPSDESIPPLTTFLPDGVDLFNPMQSTQSILADGYTFTTGEGQDAFGSWQFKAAIP